MDQLAPVYRDLPTTSIKDLEIFSVGTWNGDKYTAADLQAMVDAFDKVGFEPPVKAGHEDGQEGTGVTQRLFGAPALGYIERLFVKGGKLLADIRDVPRRFADLIRKGAYRRVSAEIYWNYKDDNKRGVYPRVLKAVAFLGAEIPALTNLKAIESLFSDEQGREFRVYDEGKKQEKRGERMEARTCAAYQEYIYSNDLQAGQAVHEDVKRFMREAGVDYRGALAARVREFARRDRAEPGPTNWQHGAGAEIDQIAKNLVKRKHISYSDGLKQAMAGSPRLAEAYLGCRVRDRAATVYELEARTPPYIGDVVSAAKRAVGAAGVSLRDAVRQILEGEPAVAQKVAGDWLHHRALVEINNQNLGSSVDRAYPVALGIVKREYPQVNQMYLSGRVSDLAMRTIFVQWFKD